VPALEGLLSRFRAAHTQALGISVDSIYCHANWARDLGGVSFPLLADFNPKGAVARSYGLYLEDAGITDRATVIIDSSGIVRHVASVTPSGERDIAAIASICEQVDREHGAGLRAASPLRGLPDGSVLYVKGSCGFSLRVLNARENLHLGDRIAVKRIDTDPSAMEELKKLTGKTQVPCLVVEGRPMLESDDITRYLAEMVAQV